MKTRRSKGREVKDERETTKEGTSPSSTSHLGNDTPPQSFSLIPDDEKVITSSTRSCDGGSPSSPQSQIKENTLNSPPDDVKAFFGHPLTRATNALNGESVDKNAHAEALLHEYIHLSVINREESKTNEKLPKYIDAINSRRSDPQLINSQDVTASSPATTAADESPDPGKINCEEEDQCGKEELSEDANQTGDSMYIGEYVDIFLSNEFTLDRMEGQTECNPETSATLQTPQSRSSARAKPKKSVLASRTQKRAPATCQRGHRKSRTKSDGVSSTTNFLYKDNEHAAVTNDASNAFSNQEVKKCCHQFSGFPVTLENPTNLLPNFVTSNSINPISSGVINSERSVVTEYVNSNSNVTKTQLHSKKPLTQIALTKDHRNLDHILTVVATKHSNETVSISLPNFATNQTPSSSASPTTATSTHSSTSSASSSSPPPSASQIITKDSSLIAKENNLKKALSDKIKSRQTTEDIQCQLSATGRINFMQDNACEIATENKYQPSMGFVKQEVPYSNIYKPQYIYNSEQPNNLISLTNYSALALTPFGNDPETGIPVTLSHCSEIMMSNDANNNGLNMITSVSLQNEQTESSTLHHEHRLSSQNHHHQHSRHSDLMSNTERISDSMIVESPQGQCFQELQPLQPFKSNSHVTSSNLSCNVMPNAAESYYNLYSRDPNSDLLETNKQAVVEHFLSQQCAYGGSYSHFLNPDTNYSLMSPDSSYQESGLSPSPSAIALKEISISGSNETRRQKPKKKSLIDVEVFPGGENKDDHTKQSYISRSDRSNTGSPVIPKLENNVAGYTYFLETPISTTQHRDEDRVTYVNKSQYYGLTLEFKGQDRLMKNVAVKSVIILAFREEKMIEEEKKAWEYWHGRQHSYKQRILDIDTKNCHGVAPQNIEEIAFNAVAVKWNPLEGPIRVNVAVHCLSTDFSNQKGVKGIPLHIQIDTYEQSPKDNYLVHRGYCQIKAFCDKGAERKTRDEERRKATKGKTEEYGNTPGVPKRRRKTEEAFHEPCDRSEFYSMVNLTTPPVFFNPLHENTEFIHKSLSLGVVPSQDEEISCLTSSHQLPDSCDDYYNNSPAKRSRRDSSSNLKEQQKILLYVREQQETVYTALMLEVPTLNGLLKSIEQKYSISPYKVKNLYKKSRKGILVKLDDNIVRHYSHETTFIIELNLLNDCGDYEIILIELDATTHTF